MRRYLTNKISLFIPVFFLCFTGALAQESMNNVDAFLDANMPVLIEKYRYLHTNPELSFLEKNTSSYLADQLRPMGYEVHERIGGYGVVGIMKNGQGPTVMLRADMDALPILEETGAPYASKVTAEDITGETVSVMHACGHDVHMTTWLGTAQFLSSSKDQWQGTLILIGQPAEERGGGSKAMLEDGLYERFGVPDFCLALHVNATLPSGQVGYCHGFALANVDMVDITVFGQGGHGAYPHTAIDPIVIASRLILDLQTIVSREISPLEPSVITVGAIHGGTKGNVIPDKVELMLTLRSYSSEVREILIEAIRRKCKAAAASAGLPEEKHPVVTVRNENTPAVFNDPGLGEELVTALKPALGEENLVEISPVMGGEDFARYGRTDEQVPIYLFWLGAVSEEDFAMAQEGQINLPALHSSRFLPDAEPTIQTGIRLMSIAALNLLKYTK